MNTVNPEKNNFSELRKNAERKLMGKTKTNPPKKTPKLVHEVNVHQIELEMQQEELHATQLKLVKSIENYTELFNHAPVAYFILDYNGIILNVNIKGGQLLGVDKKQLVGKYFSVFLNGESRQDDYYLHRNIVIETNKFSQIESEIKKKNGSIYSVLIESSTVKDEKDNFKHLLSTISDISAQKEHEHNVELALEKEKELNEMKSRFISMASHEFKTPLATILSSAFLIDGYDKTKDAEKRKKHLHKIQASVDGLKEILNEFLSISKIEQNLIENNPEKFNIVRFTEDMIAGLNTDSHTLIYAHAGKRQDVFLDAKLLKICFNNLLSNAIKYSLKGGRIEITTEKNTVEEIEISVRDYGIGIPENEQVHIFEPFFRAKNADTIQGTGLGLNIVQKLTIIMDGTVSFESKLNEGSVFVLSFSKNKKTEFLQD